MPFDALPMDANPSIASIVLLRHLEKKLSKPSRWTKGQMTTGRWWRRYCTVGALAYVATKYQYPLHELEVVQQQLDYTARRLGYQSIITLNDDSATTHANIISVIHDTLSHLELQHAIVTR